MVADWLNVVVPMISAIFGAGFWSFLIKRQEKNLDNARAETEENRADEVVINGAASVVKLQSQMMNDLSQKLDERVKNIEALYKSRLEKERAEWEQDRLQWSSEKAELEQKVKNMAERLSKLEKINKQLAHEKAQLAVSNCSQCSAGAAQG